MADGNEQQSGAPSDNTTLVEVLAEFSQAGFSADMFVTAEGKVRCGVCHHDMEPTDLELDRLQRFEGASDPADMAAILGLVCSACGARGSAVVRFGPEAGPQDDAVIQALDDHRF